MPHLSDRPVGSVPMCSLGTRLPQHAGAVSGSKPRAVVQNRVEAAYRRTDLFERRRRLMGDWEIYLASAPETITACEQTDRPEDP